MKGGSDRGVFDPVFVFFSDGGETGMEVGGCQAASGDADFRGKRVVESGLQGGGREAGFFGKVSGLSVSMNAGVGSSGAVNDDGPFPETGQGGFEVFLNGRSVGLTLPAEEGGSFVGERQVIDPARSRFIARACQRNR